MLIEVKPDCESHNIITAIGQLIAYSHNLPEVVRIVAAPGVHRLRATKPHLNAVLKAQQIELLDLDEDLRPQLWRLLAKGTAALA